MSTYITPHFIVVKGQKATRLPGLREKMLNMV